MPGLVHAVVFQSEVPSGRIGSFNQWAARQVPGVIEIMTHENAPKVELPGQEGVGESFVPLQSNRVFYNGQAIGVVIAETLEAAQEAARLVRAHCVESPAELNLAQGLPHAKVMKKMQPIGDINHERGHVREAFRRAPVKLEAVYSMPFENHNPIEPSATAARWLPTGELEVYDATQAVWKASALYGKAFRAHRDRIQVVTKFVGGAFGCKGSMWPQQFLAVMAAKKTGRPVRLVLTREQMFTTVGHRPANVQKISLGAGEDGSLLSMEHETTNNVAINKDYSERSSMLTAMLYRCDNVKTVHRVLPLNYQVPTFMRAPGYASGSFAIESALDELAYRLAIDPVDLRLRNYALRDGEKDAPFSSKSLRRCYEEGAHRFGWGRRPAKPGTQREGDWLVGYGMATAVYPSHLFEAKALVELHADGTATVSSGTQDIGTGTYTIMAQLAADGLGLPLEKITVSLGDSRLPQASVSGGSTTASSVGSAIDGACRSLLRELYALAQARFESPLYGARFEAVGFGEGSLFLRADPGKRESFIELLRRSGKAGLSASGAVGNERKPEDYSKYGFGAQFAQLRVHAYTGETRLDRMVGAFACGKILNEKTARSQFMGGMVFGIGQALMEQTVPDLRNGRLVVKDLADYHVPTHADVPPIEVVMIPEHDTGVNAIGTKGIGEIGIVGVAAAIANAAYNATGLRLRDLPLTPDKLVRRWCPT
jgi:xanthine dehydrogenase YagR molybdenum-binding subunit